MSLPHTITLIIKRKKDLLLLRGGDSNLNTGIRILPSKVLERRIPRSYLGFDSKVKPEGGWGRLVGESRWLESCLNSRGRGPLTSSSKLH